MFGLTSMNVQDRLQFLNQYPNLKALHWGVPTCSLVEVAKIMDPGPPMASSSTCSPTISLTSSSTWSPVPNVNTLVLHDAIKDSDVALILSWVKQLRKLTVFCRKFAHRSLEELRRHYHEIQEIRLEDCSRVTDTMIQEIMEQCSELLVIKAPTLH
ncbi:hypothetical protein BG011_003451 [Mortierella polycephala]|uniref:Uncharacterized protein n=1 Tax=Mortierella polycephala TaxID=41804 RepID=A0A9P6Q0U8_9FUNG|nr:hypothetical protein BG011_003451 [Mortierella polycephala]